MKNPEISRYLWLKRRRLTVILAGLTLLVFVLTMPGALRDAYERGGIYLFSREFFEDIPKRLVGPGKFRFVLQPLLATILGILNGIADARTGKPPFLYGLFFKREFRGELARSSLENLANLMLMSILMDAVFQWIILGVSHPGAAILAGPVLILSPYVKVRALANRIARLWKKR